LQRVRDGEAAVDMERLLSSPDQQTPK